MLTSVESVTFVNDIAVRTHTENTCIHRIELSSLRIALYMHFFCQRWQTIIVGSWFM